ncbi:hypothetical protein KSD_70280 [Ktedonobacter sp. SOSP1-85]|nr:hypothetical protein KSD_70280 [Ktedonobacter sp. SOSP1-85]
MFVSPHEHFLFNASAELVGNVCRLLGVHGKQEHHKFLASIASSDMVRIKLCHTLLYALAYLMEEGIPSAVPPHIIDLFEMIQIKEQHRTACSFLPAPGEQMFQCAHQCAVVTEPCEGITFCSCYLLPV